MLTPVFVNDDNSTLGLVREITDNMRVAFIAEVTKFDAENNTVDVSPVVTEQTYTAAGIDNIPWPSISKVPLSTIGFGSWYLTMPVKVGSKVLVLCTDLDFSEWYKRDQNTNSSSREYHSFKNAIAIAGINSSLTLIPNYSTTGPEIRNVDGQFSLKISEDSLQLSMGGNLSLDITGNNVNINIGGTTIATVTASGVTMPSVDLTIQGTKIFEWLTTHTHQYVSPAGPAQTAPAGPQ